MALGTAKGIVLDKSVAVSGATVKLWKMNRFTTLPKYDSALPAGSPDYGPATSAGDGSWSIASVVEDDYYASYATGGHIIWTKCGVGRVANSNGLPSQGSTGIKDGAVGYHLVAAPSTRLVADANPTATTISVANNNLASGDRIYLQDANGNAEFMAVTSAATAIAAGYTYSVTRNLDGSGANQWYTGDTVANTRQAGDGTGDLIGSAATGLPGKGSGPAWVVWQRNSATWNDMLEFVVAGRLSNFYNYGASAAYGFATGHPSYAVCMVDSTNGFRIVYSPATGGTTTFQVDTSANVTVGYVAAGFSNMRITATGEVHLRNNTTDVIVLRATAAADGTIAYFNGAIGITTSGGLYQGTGTFSVPTTGLKLWNSGGVGKIAGYNAGTIQWYGDTDGKLYAGGGNVALDTNGITFSPGSSAYIQWNSTVGGANPTYKMTAVTTSTTHDVTMITGVGTSSNDQGTLTASVSGKTGGTTRTLSFYLQAGGSVDKKYAAIYASGGAFNGLIVGVSGTSPGAMIESVASSGSQLFLTNTAATSWAAFTVNGSGVLTIAPQTNVGATSVVVTGDFHATGTTTLDGIVKTTGQFGCLAWLNTGTQSINNATWTTTNWDSETFDVGGCHDTVTNNSRFTVPTGGDGHYCIRAYVAFASNATGYRAIRFLKNGNAALGLQAQVTRPAVNGDSTTADSEWVFDGLVAGDYIEVQVWQNSGGALSTRGYGGSTTFSWVTFEKTGR